MEYLRKIGSNKTVNEANFFNKKTIEWLFVTIVLGSFFAWLILLFVQGQDSNQFNLFFIRGNNLFADFTNVAIYSRNLDPYNETILGMGEKAYPPLTYLLMYLVSRTVDVSKCLDDTLSLNNNMQYMAVVFVLISIQAMLLFSFISFHKDGNALKKYLTAFAISLSAPVLFSVERGNTIIVTSILVGIFLFYYDSDNSALREISYICLALSFNFKITPALLGILILLNKRYLDGIRTGAYAIVIFVISFLPLHGGIKNIPLLFRNINANLTSYSNPAGCTLASAMDRFMRIVGITSPDTVNCVLGFVHIVSWGIAILIIIWLITCGKHMPKYRKIFAITLILVFLPSHSGEYNTLYFIPAIIMMLNAKGKSIVDCLCFLAMTIIMLDVQMSGQRWFYFNINIGITMACAVVAITAVENLLALAWSKYNDIYHNS